MATVANLTCVQPSDCVMSFGPVLAEVNACIAKFNVERLCFMHNDLLKATMSDMGYGPLRCVSDLMRLPQCAFCVSVPDLVGCLSSSTTTPISRVSTGPSDVSTAATDLSMTRASDGSAASDASSVTTTLGDGTGGASSDVYNCTFTQDIDLLSLTQKNLELQLFSFFLLMSCGG